MTQYRHLYNLICVELFHDVCGKTKSYERQCHCKKKTQTPGHCRQLSSSETCCSKGGGGGLKQRLVCACRCCLCVTVLVNKFEQKL